MTATPTHCICGAPLPPQPKTGRRRRWCSKACRDRHRRNAAPFPSPEIPQVTSSELVALLGPGTTDPVEATARCVVLARTCSVAFATVAVKAPPALSVRCERAANAIARTLKREFKVLP